jgi:hypothetical protein
MHAGFVVILGGIVMAQTACSAWGAEPPSPVAGDLASRVGQPADIAPSAYLHRADRKPEENPPETEFLFAGALKHEKAGVICGLLWEEPRPVQRVELSWPKDARALPRPEDVVVRWPPHGAGSSWWSRRGGRGCEPHDRDDLDQVRQLLVPAGGAGDRAHPGAGMWILRPRRRQASGSAPHDRSTGGPWASGPAEREAGCHRRRPGTPRMGQQRHALVWRQRGPRAGHDQHIHAGAPQCGDASGADPGRRGRLAQYPSAASADMPSVRSRTIRSLWLSFIAELHVADRVDNCAVNRLKRTCVGFPKRA